MNSQQFAWAYLIKNGYAGVKHSLYGGYGVVDNKMYAKYGQSWDWFIKAKLEYIEQIKKIGVDWRKTVAPESDKVSCFTDTFHDPEYKEMITGVLYLKDGTKQNWIADYVELTNVFEMMASASEIESEYWYLNER